ncbi:MAG: UDP-N-acetylmuramate--L-alanine ligase [Acidimicrobiaceae bacterium]|nr:UDP-N-acetylmuramate--L-alanine ligase [Acidimicrobiaceae bacterium]
MNSMMQNTHVDLNKQLSIHIVGVGGAGMRAIALVLSCMGNSVSGSDLKNSPGLDRLQAEKIVVTIGHSRENIAQPDLVTRSTAVSDSNIEIKEALIRGIPVISRAEILSAISRTKSTVSVAGTHGKTTTSSMLAVLLAQAQLSPSFIIGGEVNEIGCGALWEEHSEILVVEADESDGTFLDLDSDYAIVTNLEPDHLEYYGGEGELRSAFQSFLGNVTNKSFVCADDSGLMSVVGSTDVITYGVNSNSDYLITEYEGSRSGSKFSLSAPNEDLGEFVVATPGIYNVRNATAALAFGHHIGADINLLRQGLAQFGGVARRFHFRGERNDVAYIDDYAHLPTEVSSVLQAVKEGEWGRIICVFQPHRYTRTSDLWKDFSHSFEDADVLFITDIFSAGEAPIPGVSGRLIVDAVKGAYPEKPMMYGDHREELIAQIRQVLSPGDVCLTLGAGDITTLPNELMLGD